MPGRAVIERSFAVAADHPACVGHFPGRPILPGVVLLDHVLALAAEASHLVPPVRLGRVKFLATVTPGSTVHIRLVPVSPHKLGFTCTADDRPLMSGTAEYAAATP